MTAELDAHGTHAGYQRHARRDEEPCEPCREAARAYQRRYRHNNAEQRQKNRAYSKARNRALRRLLRLHPADFSRLLDEERADDRDEADR